mmetsp:Transcript_10002/g.34509  ORF Transcript_10002/g.34509 Transcript_10002/m.34509 type:complete len:170 (+) Transcript_10002:846-1355(+)
MPSRLFALEWFDPMLPCGSIWNQGCCSNCGAPPAWPPYWPNCAIWVSRGRASHGAGGAVSLTARELCLSTSGLTRRAESGLSEATARGGVDGLPQARRATAWPRDRGKAAAPLAVINHLVARALLNRARRATLELRRAPSAHARQPSDRGAPGTSTRRFSTVSTSATRR